MAKISDLELDTDVTGNELIPVADGTTTKSVKISQIVSASIKALFASGTTDSLADSVFTVMVGLDSHTVTVSQLIDYFISGMFGKATSSSLKDTMEIVVDDGGTAAIITLANFKKYVASDVSAQLGLTELDPAEAFSSEDSLLVSQSGKAKSATFANFSDAILAGIASWISKLPIATAPNDTDLVTLYVGGVAKSITISSLKAALGNVTTDGDTPEDGIPQWASGTKKLKAGKTVVETVRAAGTATHTSIPTELAVRTAIDGISGVTPPAAHNEGNLPQWGAGNTLTDGKSVQTEIRATATASDDAIPTEKAVRAALDGVDAVTLDDSNPAASGIPQWKSAGAKQLTAGLVLRTTVRESGTAADDGVPTESAVRTALNLGISGVRLDALAAPSDGSTLDATSALHGLMSKADKAKLDGIKAGADKTADSIDTDATLAGNSDSKVSSQKAVKTYVDGHEFTAVQMTGATSAKAGTGGAVPAPAAAENVLFLRGDGTWAQPGVSAGVDVPSLSENAAPAETDELVEHDGASLKKLSIGSLLSLLGNKKRYRTLFVPAGAFTPSSVDPATASTVVQGGCNHDAFLFSASKNQSVDFSFSLPDEWDGGKIRAKIIWIPFDTNANEGEKIGFFISGKTVPDGTVFTTALGSSVEVTDSVIGNTDLHVTGTSPVITLGGSSGKSSLVTIHLERDFDYAGSGETTMDVQLYVIGVMIQYGESGLGTEAWN